MRSVHIGTNELALGQLAGDPTRWRPSMRETVNHSIPYVVACVLHFGYVVLDHFNDEMLHNPDLLNLMDKIKVELDPTCQDAWPGSNLNILSVENTDGLKYKAEIPHHLGYYRLLMSDHDIEMKFRKLCKNFITPRNKMPFLKLSGVLKIWMI